MLEAIPEISNRLEGIVAEVISHRPGLLLLGGDYVNMQPFGGGRVRPEQIAEVLAPLARCHAGCGRARQP